MPKVVQSQVLPQRHLLVRLSGFYLFYYAIIGTFLPYWNVYLGTQGFDAAQIGWLSSIGVITRCIAPFVWGYLADRSGQRMLWVRIATLVEAMIWGGIFFIHPSFAGFALIMLIFTFFQNAILAQFESVTLFWLGDQRDRTYAKVRRWGSIGFIIGVLSVGGLLIWLPMKHLPLILLVISSLAFFWSFTIQEPASAPPPQRQLASIVPVLKQTPVWCFFVIEWIMLFSQAPFYSFYSNYLTAYHYSSVQIGALWSVGVLAEISLFALSGWFFSRLSWRFNIVLCIVINAIRWVIVGLFPDIMSIQLIAQCGHAFSFGLFHLIAMRLIVSYFSPEQQGRGQALYSMMWGLGVAMGSVLAGHYWEAFGGQSIFIAAGLLSMIALIFVTAIQPKNEPLSS